jgi:ABC-2 type transport system ATP-binding protein
VQPPAPAIVVRGLVKSFGKVQALRGVDLEVPRGTVLGLLGPNGAGKTTLVRILATLLRPDRGTAAVAGHDVVRDAARLREKLGLAGQAAAVDEHLTGRENLELTARFRHLPKAAAKAHAAALLRRVGLDDAADRPAKGYSGGMRRRLDLAMSLVGDPEVVFLDEPTSGLDPPSRAALWGLVEELRAAGKTVLLTTQYLEEADRLADTIAVVDQGRIIARGTPAELKAQVGGDVVEVSGPNLDAAALAARLGMGASASGRRVRVPAPDGARTLAEVMRRLDPATLAQAEVALRRPTLDDVFLALTGHDSEEGPGEAPAPAPDAYDVLRVPLARGGAR